MFNLGLKYPGSKMRDIKKLLALAPGHFNEFREPFCGACPWLSVLPRAIPRWINDSDKRLIHYLKALRDDPELVPAFLRYRKRAAKSLDACFDLFQRLKRTIKTDAAAYLFVRRLAHKQIVHEKRKNICNFSHVLAHSGALKPLSKSHLKKLVEVIQGVRITCSDYSRLLTVPPMTSGPVFVFLDPPYLISHHQSGLYHRDFDRDQRAELKDKILSLDWNKWKVMLTVEWSDYSFDEYWLDKRFNCYKLFYKSRMKNQSFKEKGTESVHLVVCNY